MPKGIKKKGWKMNKYLISFRGACKQCEEFFTQCKIQNCLKTNLIGEGDLTDIAKLFVHDVAIQVKNISANLKFYDAILAADMINHQTMYNIKDKIKKHQLLNLNFLSISRDVS